MSIAKAMEYEMTPVKSSKLSGTKLALAQLERVGTVSILWYLVKRHKFGLVAAWAITVTIIQLFPFAPDMLLSLLG